MKTPLIDKPAIHNFSFSGVKNAFRKLIAAEMRHVTSAVDREGVAGTDNDNGVELPLSVVARVCALFQETVFDHLRDKLESVLGRIERQHHDGATAAATAAAGGAAGGITGIVVVGGVASNQELRRILTAVARKYTVTASDDANFRQPLPVYFPPVSLCTDNGVMVAYSGVLRLLHTRSSDSIGFTAEVSPATNMTKSGPTTDGDDNSGAVCVNGAHERIHPFEDLARARWPLVKSPAHT